MLIDYKLLSYTILILHIKGKNQYLMTKFLIKNKKSFLITLFSIFFVICLIIANYLSLMIIKTESVTQDITTPEFEIYMLSLSKSQVENEASTIAPDYRKIGAGGFVWEKEGYFYVISSAYLNKNDAELVQNSIKLNQNIESEVICVKFKSFTINGSFNNEEKKVILKALAMAQDFYSSIYDIAISLDTGVYNEISAKLAVNSTTNNIATSFANFDTLFPSPTTQPLLNINNLCKNVVKIAQKLSADERFSQEQTYSSNLKYRYLQALSLYFNFINE